MADVTQQPAQQPAQQSSDPVMNQFMQMSRADTAAEQQHLQQKQAALNPLYDAAQRAFQQPMPEQPKPVQLPQPNHQPIVDAKQYEQFSMGMLGLALVSGALSKNHWMRAISSLNGAMDGYLKGSEAIAMQHKQQFEDDFKVAVQQEKMQNDAYLATLNQRDKTIKEILAEAEVVAAKYGMVDAQDAITRRDHDKLFQVYMQRETALERIQQHADQFGQTVKDRQIARYDKMAANGEITPDQRDQAVQALQEGRTPDIHSGAAGGGVAENLEIPIQQYLQTGKMPSLGMKNPAARNKIFAGAAEAAKKMGLTPNDVVTAWATRPADMSALAQVTKQQAAIGNFEATAEKNMQLAQQAAAKVDRTSYSKFINTWLQKGRVQTGDANADAFNAALETFVSEYAKVMGGGSGAGAPTEGAQARAHGILSTADTPDQLKAKMDLMTREMHNRTESIEEERQKIIGRIRGGAGGGGGGGGGGNVMRFDAQGNLIQ